MTTRRTANEWVDRLRQVLGGGIPGAEQVADIQAVKQVTAPYVRDDGPDVSSSIQCAPRSFQITGGAQYVQIIPNGYYDGVIIAVCNNDTVTVSLPVFAAFGKLQPTEGRYAMGVTVGNFAIANPPLHARPAQDNCNSLEFNLPLTNAPLLVWADDGINPSSTGTYPLTVTLVTRRH